MPPPRTSELPAPQDTAATFCATLIDEWVHHGVGHAVIAPGSRSTVMALALAERNDIRVHVFHDERAAAFAALGIGLQGTPAVLLCTSGTAATHFHGAVVEAHLSAVPMIVCTADRPPELRDVGAPQTIDQTQLYGNAVRWFHDPGVADEAARGSWRSLAAHAFAASTGGWPGPVHLNLSFREPLVGVAGALPARRGDGSVTTTGAAGLDATSVDRLAGSIGGRRGVVVAGRGCGGADAVHALARALGWPVLADARSGLRHLDDVAVAAADAILRSESFADEHLPEVVVRLGEPPASKVLNQWLTRSGAHHVHVTAIPSWTDPDGTLTDRVVADPAQVCRLLAESLRGGSLQGRLSGADPDRLHDWLKGWMQAERDAQGAIDLALGGQLSEPNVARTVVGSMSAGSQLVVSSSMPIRDVEWYGLVPEGVEVHSNRGANGIDGVIATAIGVAAATGARTRLLIGDVAFLHDSSALVGLMAREFDLRIVVVDNDGGGIFSFLPQATALAGDRFEQLFGTPHGVDLAALAGAHGIPVDVVDSVAGLVGSVASAGPGVTLVRSQRAANVAVHAAVHDAVTRSVTGG